MGGWVGVVSFAGGLPVLSWQRSDLPDLQNNWLSCCVSVVAVAVSALCLVNSFATTSSRGSRRNKSGSAEQHAAHSCRLVGLLRQWGFQACWQSAGCGS